jgi:YD repeat-containing protein
MPDDLRSILEALPFGADVELTTVKDEFGRVITRVTTGRRVITLDYDATSRTGAALPVGGR